jgi:two-component sensor histidine kinase
MTLVICITSQAQNYADKNYYLVDSLDMERIVEKEKKLIEVSLTEYHSTTQDSTKIKALFNIINQSLDPYIWNKYNQFAFDFIDNKLNNYYIAEVVENIPRNRLLQLKADALTNKGAFFKIEKEYSKALDYLLEALVLEKILPNKLKLAKTLNSVGYCYKKTGELSTALTYYKDELKVREHIGNKKSIAITLFMIGLTHENQGQLSNALEFFYKSLKIREDINDQKGIASCFNFIASVYKNQGSPDTALKYYYKSLVIQETIKNVKGTSIILNNIGVVYKNQKEYSKALSFYQKSLKLKEQLKDDKGRAHVLNNIGTVYKEKGSLQKAIDYYKKSLAISTSLKDKKWTSVTLFNVGSIYLKQGNTSEAYKAVENSLRIAQETGNPALTRDASEILITVYQKQRNWKKALELHQLYIKMRDSIRNEKTENEVLKQLAAYEMEKKQQELREKQQEILLLSSQNEIQELRLNRNRILIILFSTAFGLASILILLVFRGNKKKKVIYKLLKKQKEDITKKNEEKIAMLKEVHHRMKNNLQMVNSLLKFQSREIEDEKIIRMFKDAQNRVLSMSLLHEKMYNSKDLQHVGIKEHLTLLINDIVKSYAIGKNIKLDVDIEDVDIGMRTLVPIGLIVNEMITNTLKYAFETEKGGTITVNLRLLDSKQYELIIGDDGEGLSSEKKAEGLGTKLIQIFSKQLNGTMTKLDQSGTFYKLVFEKIDIL